MRDDQYLKLKSLSEKLTDVVLEEANPDNWHGKGAPIASLTRDDRGDRYWSKKNAAATLSVLMKIHSLTGMMERTLAGSGNPGDSEGADETDLDKEVRRAEREAARLLNKIQSGQREQRRSKS